MSQLVSASLPKAKNKSVTLVFFDIDKAIRDILDENILLHLRALRLYELQIAIIKCRPLERKILAGSRKLRGPEGSRPNGFSLVVSEGFFARARSYACMRLLQHLELEHSAQTKEVPRHSTMLKDPAYAALLDDYLASDGWRWALASSNVSEFQEWISAARFCARQTSKLIAFSLRFQTLRNFPRKVGGINTARQVLCALGDKPMRNADLENFRPLRSESSLKTYWKGHKYAPALIYLAYFEKNIVLRPPNISSREFAGELLRRVSDCEDLKKCLGRHNAIAKELIKFRDYATELICCSSLPNLPLGPPIPLPRDLIALANSKG